MTTQSGGGMDEREQSVELVAGDENVVSLRAVKLDRVEDRLKVLFTEMRDALQSGIAAAAEMPPATRAEELQRHALALYLALRGCGIEAGTVAEVAGELMQGYAAAEYVAIGRE